MAVSGDMRVRFWPTNAHVGTPQKSLIASFNCAYPFISNSLIAPKIFSGEAHTCVHALPCLPNHRASIFAWNGCDVRWRHRYADQFPYDMLVVIPKTVDPCSHCIKLGTSGGENREMDLVLGNSEFLSPDL